MEPRLLTHATARLGHTFACVMSQLGGATAPPAPPLGTALSTWNEWTEEELLLQLAGHLRGRTLQEWPTG